MPQADLAIVDSLNEPQKQAVTAEDGHHLILAGAGSGKTRVLVHRIAWLIHQQGVSPYGVLALTFTNKAAKQMRTRLEDLLQQPMPGMWLGTFHGICHRFLRQHAQEAKIDEHFQIIDTKDQLQIIKRIQKEMNLSDQKWPAQKTLYIIQNYKSQGLRTKDIPEPSYAYEQKCLEVYQTYEDYCLRSHSVDFTELMLKTLEVLKTNPELLQKYHERFSYILIDEFQDTNTMQYDLLKILTGKNTYVMAVGDDDQSIYSWRGACVDHMHQFVKQFKKCTTIKLEQNYRSTETILKAANAVIEHNEERLGKDLWTEETSGEKIKLFTAYNDIDEARYIIDQIKEHQLKGDALDQIAILYRSNAQSRVIEDQLTHANLPYRVYGGLRFFDRAEIKDALNYCRLIVTRADDAAFERIVNKPARGIGHATIAKLRETASLQQCSLWQAISETTLTTRASTALKGFTTLIEDMDHRMQNLELGEQINLVIQSSGLLELYKQEEPNTYQNRVENLQELVNAAKVFAQDTSQEIVTFLASISLDAGDQVDDDYQPKVQLMTIHAAKGLEFNTVFLSGLEEGLFPHQMSLRESGLEEERRLCYVAMTRAKKNLTISHAQSRRLNGQTNSQYRSRFIGEIPAEYVENNTNEPNYQSHDHSTTYQKPSWLNDQQMINGRPLQLGQMVQHNHFGTGTVLNCEGSGSQTRIQIKFDDSGVKWLMLSHAPLEIL